MQEKKNKRLAISLILLTALVVMVLFLDGRRSSNTIDKELYRGIDLKSVDRVVLKSKNDTVDLGFQGYRWKVNDSIEADRGLIEVLFATLQQTEPKRPVAESLRDSVVRALKDDGVNVQLFAGDEVLLSFFAGGDGRKTQGIFLREGADTPHIVGIPGYRVYASGIFEVPAIGWREKLVFNLNWQNFSHLKARYRNPAGDFDVRMEDKQLAIPGIAEVDTARLNSWLDDASLLMVEEYVEEKPLTDSLAGVKPLVELVFQDIANRKYSLAVFAVGNTFYGRIGEKHWAILPENSIVPLLRSKDFFIKR